MTRWLVACALAVFGAVWSTSSRGRLCRLERHDRVPARQGWRPSLPLLGLAAVAGCTGWLLMGGRALLLVVGAGFGVACAVLRRLSDGMRGRRRRDARRRAVIELCDSLSAELRAGLPADRTLERSCAVWPEWAGIATAARLGGDVLEAMRRAATEPGAEGLRAVAAGWEVAGRSGAGLSTVLARVAAGLRSDDEARSEVIASLGPPRATAKMLAVLPVFGLGLGSSMGARPLAFLLHTDLGLTCLATGLVLASLGVLWVERLASAAEV